MVESSNESAITNHDGRVASHDGAGRHRATHHGTDGDHGARADLSVWGKHSPGGNPGVIADGDGSKPEIKPGRTEVVVAGTEINALGEADAITNSDMREVVEPGVFCQPARLAHLQAPGEFHAKAGLETAASADASTEDTKQLHPPS